MAKLSDRDSAVLTKMLQALIEPVQIKFFFGETEADRRVDAILQPLEEASASRITVKRYRFQDSRPAADLLGITRGPALAYADADGHDSGMRFIGVPSGYQFATVLDDILDISRHATRLDSHTRQVASDITDRMRIKVYVIPT